MTHKCPKCGAPASPSAPDGDFRYRPPVASEKDRALRMAAEKAAERLEPICKAYPDDGWSVLVLAALRGALR